MPSPGGDTNNNPYSDRFVPSRFGTGVNIDSSVDAARRSVPSLLEDEAMREEIARGVGGGGGAATMTNGGGNGGGGNAGTSNVRTIVANTEREVRES